MPTCSSCHEAVVWTVTEASGKRMPIDPEPVPDGNLIIVDYDDRRRPIVRYLTKDEEPPGLRYISHFATCTYPERHRK